jgi:anti-sigma factor (TIGR02949 family)
MNCTLFRRHVDAFLDAEVDPTTQIEFERHVAACAGCQEFLAFQRALKRSVRAALGDHRAPEALRARIAEVLAAPPPPRVRPLPRDRDLAGASTDGAARGPAPLLRVHVLPRRYAAPLALVAAAALIGLWVSRGGPSAVGGETDASVASALPPIFEDVARLHSTPLPADVADPRDEQVVSYFRGKVEFPVRPAAFPRENAKLVGARVSNVSDRRAAALYYDLQGQRMTVVVFADPRVRLSPDVVHTPVLAPGIYVEHVGNRPVLRRKVGGYTVSAVQYDGLTYAITGDMDERTLVRLAGSVQVH